MVISNKINLNLSWRRPSSYRNQSIDLRGCIAEFSWYFLKLFEADLLAISATLGKSFVDFFMF